MAIQENEPSPKKDSSGPSESPVAPLVTPDSCLESSAAPAGSFPARDPWLTRFYAGERQALAECYQDYFQTVEGAVGRVLRGADLETVIHEVFFRLLTSEELRRRFLGGSFRAWISAVSRNHALDYWRRRQFELPAGAPEDYEQDETAEPFEDEVEVRMVMDRFREEYLPQKWQRVFDARFVQQLEQADAARTLGLHRTTLLYQEYRIRTLLKRFVVGRGRA
ncbi:MAG TPA: sigma-70 family RNA polymerase sigma factor [Polyangiaceae bacterium]|jgi:RNA polymerase sigma-70 factor (ECF subfamily)|nr:sigma-70 family RNA polymerase sigma factor [Polyangiaceae bacterium]